MKEEGIYKRVVCPYCGYRMPIEYSHDATSKGVFVKCKGAHCKKDFELVIKDGVQYKRRYLLDKFTGFFRSVF